MHSKEVVLDGQRLAYYESDGKGRPVLFLHGNSMSGLSFEKQFASSLGESCRLVALDLPGHGRSAPAQEPKSACTLPAYADIVHKFTQRLGLDDALLVGWSFGGHVLLEAMGQMQESAGLMIFGAPPIGKPLAADAFIPHPLMPLLFTSDLSREEAASLTAAFFMPDCRIPEFFYEDMRRTDGRAREALAISIGEGNYTDELRIVADLRKPLAIVHGENDPLVSLPYINELNIPTLWRREVQIIPDAGHTPHWERAERFNSLLTEFIQATRQ